MTMHYLAVRFGRCRRADASRPRSPHVIRARGVARAAYNHTIHINKSYCLPTRPVYQVAGSGPRMSCRLGPDPSARPAARPGGRRQVVALIAVASLCRLVLAASLGLGVDESYAFAVARPFSLSYFDHPPLAFWIVGAARQLGTSPLLLRAPFIALFAATTWLLFRTTSLLFDQCAAYWSVVVISLSPVFTISSASWILPDGPLLFGLVLAAYAAAKIRFRDDAPDLGDWSILGLGVGIAALSKYHAVLFAAGLGLWVATDSGARRCIR